MTHPHITLRFVDGGGFVAATIQKFEYGFWADHVECLMPDGKTIIGAYLGKGVQRNVVGYDASTSSEELYVPVPCSQEQQDKFYAFIESQVGKPYDTKAVLGIALERNWQDPGQWFCSELQTAGMIAAGIFPEHLATQLNHVTPRDLLLIVSGRVLVQLQPVKLAAA